MQRPALHPDPEPRIASAHLAALAAGNLSAWEQTVAEHEGLLTAVARAYGLDAQAAADVRQSTWLLLLEHAGSVHRPERLRAWLATTAKHECLRIIAARRREQPVAVPFDVEPDAGGSPPDAALLGTERDAAVQQALRALPPRCQRLLGALMLDPAPSYAEVSATLGLPIGSIGPTRARCLACLRRLRGLREVA
jgi:RNA polymerase sigma factor (sigma-70 family)